MVQKPISMVLLRILFCLRLSLQLPTGNVDDSFDGSHNDCEVAFNSTMEQASMKPCEMGSTEFQVQNTNRLKRDSTMFDWIERTVEDSSNWVGNATEDAANWIAYMAGNDTIKWIGPANNDTNEWITQTAIDRDVWIFNAQKNEGKWTDDVPIETFDWINGTVYHCIHKFILVQVIIRTNGDAVGGVIQGGPNGAAIKAVEYCVKNCLLKNKNLENVGATHSKSNDTNETNHKDETKPEWLWRI